MPRMIQQTKNAIKKLLAAGLDRDEFSVRTPKDKHGEWGRAEISLRNCSTSRIKYMIPDMIAQGLYVRIFHAGPWWAVRVHDHEPKNFCPDEKNGKLQKVGHARHETHGDYNIFKQSQNSS